MKRRKFIQLTATASAISLIPSEVFALLKSVGISECPDLNAKKIVLIQLAGANDGINTIVPLNQYDLYAQLRPNLKLNLNGPNGIIPLDTTLALENQIGLHPTLTGFKNLYDSGLMRIVQGVGYPNSNKSHFKSSDLWLSGGDGTPANFTSETGWMGRFIENYYADFLHESYPLGIQMGSGDNSLGFHGAVEHGLSININNQDMSGFYSVVNGLGGVPPTTIPNSEYGERIQFLTDLDASANLYSNGISNAFNSGTNANNYPDTDVANQLKTIARFISGGLKTKFYLVRLGGFDTHEVQIPSNTTPHLGNHAVLLKQLSDGINAFITDLNQQNKGNDVLAVTFSEFGRKAAENGSLGTDHGEVAPMFVFGNSVNPGISGTNVNLSEAIEANNYQVQTVQHDYRRVFSTILQDWLGAENAFLDLTFYDNTTQTGFTDFKFSELINEQNKVAPACYKSILPPIPGKTNLELVIYPNPTSDYIYISGSQDCDVYTVMIHTAEGKYIDTIRNPILSSDFNFNVQNLAVGIYHLKIQTKKGVYLKKMMIHR